MKVPWIDNLHIPLHFSLFPSTVFPYIPQQLASYSFHKNVGSDKHWIAFASYKVFGEPYVGQRGLEVSISFSSETEGPDVVMSAIHDTSIHGLRVTETRNTQNISLLYSHSYKRILPEVTAVYLLRYLFT
jgi:hypothetical protein